MAVIIPTADRVKPLGGMTPLVFNAFANIPLAAGDLVYYSPSTGRLVKCVTTSGTTSKCIGMVLEAVGTGQVTSVLQRGLVGGFTLSGNYGTDLYAQDTAGAVGDAAGTNSLVIGKVFAVPDNSGSPTKVLFFNAPTV